MRRRRAGPATLMVASLGLQILLQGVIGSVWGTEPRYIANPFPSAPVTIGPLSVTVLELFTVGLSAATVLALLSFLAFNKRGRALLAVAEEPQMAQIVGISEQRMRLLAFGLGTLVAGPAAILIGFRSGLAPDMGGIPLLYSFAAVIVGGIGSVRGTILGLLLLLVVSSVAVYNLPTYWSQGIAFIILLGFMLWRPRGLLGRAQRASAA
jgi:branched-chain amino acid transport system permease protein